MEPRNEPLADLLERVHVVALPMRVRFRGILERELCTRLFRRAHGRCDRRFRREVTRREQVMSDRARLTTVALLDRFGRAQMEPRALRRIELVGDRFSDERVREAKAIGRGHRDHSEPQRRR